MSTQSGRGLRPLIEPPRPLKSTLKQSSLATHQQQQQQHFASSYQVQSIDELITLMENIAGNLSAGICNSEGITMLSANLQALGMQLEQVAKDTLDKAFVVFRNASQDERLSIMTRLNLLELIELRAKEWQVSDDINSYYKHKASNVEVCSKSLI